MEGERERNPPRFYNHFVWILYQVDLLSQSRRGWRAKPTPIPTPTPKKLDSSRLHTRVRSSEWILFVHFIWFGFLYYHTRSHTHAEPAVGSTFQNPTHSLIKLESHTLFTLAREQVPVRREISTISFHLPSWVWLGKFFSLDFLVYYLPRPSAVSSLPPMPCWWCFLFCFDLCWCWGSMLSMEGLSLIYEVIPGVPWSLLYPPSDNNTWVMLQGNVDVASWVFAYEMPVLTITFYFLYLSYTDIYIIVTISHFVFWYHWTPFIAFLFIWKRNYSKK